MEREKEQMMREKEELMLRLQDYEQKTKKAEKGGPRSRGVFPAFHMAPQTDSSHTRRNAA